MKSFRDILLTGSSYVRQNKDVIGYYNPTLKNWFIYPLELTTTWPYRDFIREEINLYII